MARVKALLKRYRIVISQKIEIGGLSMDRKTHEASVNGEALNLPPKSSNSFSELASYPGKTLARDQLIEDIWGYGFEGNERTVDVHINRLRERFPEDRYAFRIRTIRGLGYRLEARVRAAPPRPEDHVPRGAVPTLSGCLGNDFEILYRLALYTHGLASAGTGGSDHRHATGDGVAGGDCRLHRAPLPGTPPGSVHAHHRSHAADRQGRFQHAAGQYGRDARAGGRAGADGQRDGAEAG